MTEPWFNIRPASSLKSGGFSLKTNDASSSSKSVSGTSELTQVLMGALAKPQKSIKTNYLEVDTQATFDCPVAITGDTFMSRTTVTGDVEITGNLTVRDGNLLVTGQAADLQLQTLTISDNNVELNTRPDATDANADGGGIIVHGSASKLFTYDMNAASWFSSENVYLPPYKGIYLGHPSNENSWRFIAGQGSEAGQLFIQKRQGGQWRTTFAFQ